MPVATRTRRHGFVTSENSSESPRKKRRSSDSQGETLDAGINDADASNVDFPKDTFYFQGVEYNSYSEMVEAKREYNRTRLEGTGLLDTVARIHAEQLSVRAAKRGLAAAKKKMEAALLPRRQSSRLAGVQAEEIYIEEERGGKLVFKSSDATSTTIDKVTGGISVRLQEESYRGRVNDGSDLSVEQAVSFCEDKWQTSLAAAQEFLSNDLTCLVTLDKSRKSVEQQDENPEPASRAYSDQEDGLPLIPLIASSESADQAASGKHKETESRMISPTKSSDVASLQEQIQSLNVNDEECVAKVTPRRIYSVAFHPSSTALIACAGDKDGYLGVWNVDRYSSTASSSTAPDSTEAEENGGVHLLRPHTSPVTHLEWDRSGTNMYSISYDSSVRKFDIHTQVISEVFAAYDNSAAHRGKLGYGIDEGNRFWIQYGCLDPRQEQNMFLSTSTGHVLHLDFRSSKSGRITFNEELSEKKINTVSLHPNGTTFATSGLDGVVHLWDIRKFHSSSRSGAKRRKEGNEALATWNCGKSINSAFFSPSGSNLLCTTMNNTLDIVRDAHLQTGTMTITKRIRHDNMTGRWLTTFMAQWHPTVREDLFVVGSMARPRRIEIFDGSSGNLIRGIQGDALTSVSSRCCFHPSEEKLILCGGNSSGRVTICR